MRAAVFRGAGRPLQVESVPDPVPGPGQIVLKVERCGICGTDLHLTDGHSGPAVPDGTVLGHETAGEVVALGAGVDNLVIGDRVSALGILGCGRCASCLAGEPVWCRASQPNYGGFAEFALAGALTAVRRPGALSAEDGALVEPLSVSLHGARLAGIGAGAHVRVIGAGPVGLAAIFWARKLGAAKVTVIEKSAARGALAVAMGAHSWAEPAPPPEAGQAIGFDSADPATMPDVVFECVGRPGLLAEAVRQVRARGTVVSLGFCMAADTLVPALACVKEATLRFPIGYSVREFEISMDALEAGAVEPRLMVTGTVGLESTPAAFERLRTDPTDCKVMIDPWSAN